MTYSVRWWRLLDEWNEEENYHQDTMPYSFRKMCYDDLPGFQFWYKFSDCLNNDDLKQNKKDHFFYDHELSESKSHSSYGVSGLLM